MWLSLFDMATEVSRLTWKEVVAYKHAKEHKIVNDPLYVKGEA